MTRRGSGVRLPHRPPRLTCGNLRRSTVFSGLDVTDLLRAADRSGSGPTIVDAFRLRHVLGENAAHQALRRSASSQPSLLRRSRPPGRIGDRTCIPSARSWSSLGGCGRATGPGSSLAAGSPTRSRQFSPTPSTPWPTSPTRSSPARSSTANGTLRHVAGIRLTADPTPLPESLGIRPGRCDTTC